MQKSTLLIAALVFAVFAAAFLLQLLKKPSLLRVAQKPILTPNEIEFFGRLRTALPELAIFPQVAMGALLKPDASGKDYHRIRGTFAQKIIDFVICDPETLEVIVLVELDDRTHDASKDAKRDKITGAAGYKTIRWQSKTRPEPDEIRKSVLAIA